MHSMIECCLHNIASLLAREVGKILTLRWASADFGCSMHRCSLNVVASPETAEGGVNVEAVLCNYHSSEQSPNSIYIGT